MIEPAVVVCEGSASLIDPSRRPSLTQFSLQVMAILSTFAPAVSDTFSVRYLSEFCGAGVNMRARKSHWIMQIDLNILFLPLSRLIASQTEWLRRQNKSFGAGSIGASK